MGRRRRGFGGGVVGLDVVSHAARVVISGGVSNGRQTSVEGPPLDDAAEFRRILEAGVGGCFFSMQDAKIPRGSNDERPAAPLSAPVALFLGWIGFGMVSGATLALVQRGSSGLSGTQRFRLHLYDFGHALALGCAVAAGVWLWDRWKESPRFVG